MAINHYKAFACSFQKLFHILHTPCYQLLSCYQNQMNSPSLAHVAQVPHKSRNRSPCASNWWCSLSPFQPVPTAGRWCRSSHDRWTCHTCSAPHSLMFLMIIFAVKSTPKPMRVHSGVGIAKEHRGAQCCEQQSFVLKSLADTPKKCSHVEHLDRNHSMLPAHSYLHCGNVR